MMQSTRKRLEKLEQEIEASKRRDRDLLAEVVHFRKRQDGALLREAAFRKVVGTFHGAVIDSFSLRDELAWRMEERTNKAINDLKAEVADLKRRLELL